MAQANILVVDDEENLLKLIRYNLAKEGYTVSCARSGEEALAASKSQVPDLVILDVMLPGIDGFDVCKSLKHEPRTANIPVIILTARDQEGDIVAGLELGADDYVTKPFSPRVLLARVKAALRRRSRPPEAHTAVLRLRDIVIHPGRHEVTVKGKSVELTPMEFRILHHLARSPGWVFTREQIIDEIRGEEYPVTDRSIDVHVAALRKKLGSFGKNLETVHGVGYRLKEV
ncbi:MAG: response regulator transcription factor [Candidatus Eisenbacteria bacterium]|nr:response regulator transcription factor [Candidatus Eisenbacteria bacterium]